MKYPDTASGCPAPTWWRRPGVLLAALALVAYAVLLARHVGTYAAGSDASGYMNHARLLAAGHLHATPRVLSGFTPEERRGVLFVPLGFVPAPDGHGMVPTYPAGLPLLVAAAAQLIGWDHAGDVVLCAHALLGLLLTYGLARTMGLSRRGAVLGATIIAASPLYLHYSLQMMSDLPALVWTSGAVLAAWRSRERAAWALAAGAATAMAVLIRPGNVLIFAPIAVALGLSPRRWLLLIAGGLPGGIFFCFYSLSLYGRLFTTGYGNLAWLFGPEWIGITWWHYARWLPALFTPVVLLVLGLPWLARTMPRQAALLGVWVLVYAAFYSAYDCTHQTWWYLRFLLPAVPPLVVGGLLVARQAGAGRRWPLQRSGVFVFALIVVIANSALWNKRLRALEIGRDSEVYPETAAWLRANLPGNAVIMAMQMSGTLTYYTDFTFVRWDVCNADDRPRLLAALHDSRRPLYAALFPFETEAALDEHLPGRWTQVGNVRSEVEIWRRDSNDAPAPPAAVSSQPGAQPACLWHLPIDQPASVLRVYLFFNLAAWLVLAGLLWRLLPGNNWRDWLARVGVLLSAGAIGSIRFALTDLIALALLAGAMLALERRRHGWAAGLLGVAAIGRGAALVALPALGSTPWFSRPNLRRWLPVLALFAVSLVGVGWHLGSVRQISTHLAWPFGAMLNTWLESLTAVLQGQDLGLAWIGLAALFALTVQAAFFLHYWREGEPWWRLGIASVVLMCFLDDAMWMGAAGGVTRQLLPLTFAFNIFARRCRAPAAWLLAGNLAVVTGILSAFYPPDPPSDMAAIRAAGVARLSGTDQDWMAGERSPRHTWSWSRGSTRLNLETWPHASQLLLADFTLRSLTPRIVIIRQDGQELWRGTVSRNYTRARFSCRLTEGHALLDMVTDSPAVLERSGPEARTLAFAVYDPRLAVQEP
ncbi:MAG TPA: hypothetical protein VFC28_10180 [Opitutaceae bacterium]|nr:hypothetical protein [Opitutaceae bacterium]